MYNDLGVRVRLEAVAVPFQFDPQLSKIINFAIISDPDRPIFIAHRLFACGREVDDAQPPMTQAESPLYRLADLFALSVRSPVPE